MPHQTSRANLSREHARNPGDIPLDTFPAELLYYICSLVPKASDGVKNFRLTCKTLTAVGAEYLVDELHLYLKRSSFNYLLAVSEHAAGKGATSLVCEGDRLEAHRSFEAWNNHKDLVAPGDFPGPTLG